ncbi:hypothetical protein sscle_13g092630 [Sclerotinia sclerotiorum 1980 UF-70]|uniref:HTH CENPB-type domain-containing protein n=1 Tax=Sclerotinia sclerotiorum (strain ATCC 18683 / 1980 / Ss-1) TaxID=665079 RepID=A0A1D9QIP5_SCLS1|nr:hypothetical protein sscle_13g092630 [Sclerotinia sclerotiorum 1980 UF-70]
MESNDQEGRILLAIEAINKDQKLSIRKVAKLYNILRTKIQRRMDGTTPCIESRANNYNLIKLEEEVFIQYIIDMDERGFAPKLSGVEDMANYILESQGAKKVGKLWAHCFVKRCPELKMCFNCVYDFQRALCEDPKLIEE